MSGEPGSGGHHALRVRHVSKTFAIPRHRSWTLKERMRHPIKSMGHERLRALDDVSFDVAPGEFFAIIGPNGSGKSTLLRCIAGIHAPDEGDVAVHARLAPFIELGVGFHPQLAAPDNVTVAGTLMGLRPAEARRRFPKVIGFAELEDFIDLPLANYSSGMQVRLAFATSFQVDAEVLLFDEVLAVGDELFQRKCMETFERLISEGHTIVYVSHSLDTIRKFADRVLLLDHGRMVQIGEPEAVLEAYERRNRERERVGIRPGEPDGYAEVVDAWLESEDGGRTSVLTRGERATFRFQARLRRDMERPTLGFAVRDREGRVVLSETDRWRRRQRGLAVAGHVETFTAHFPTRLEPGSYEAAPLLAPPEGAGMLELRASHVPVRVEGPPPARRIRELATAGGAPESLGARARRFVDVTLTLARAEFKLRYLDSIVGYLWALAQPLLMFAVLYLIWSRIVKSGHHVEHYQLKLLLGIALFTFFTEATGHALPSLVQKGTMLRKIPFPALAVPIASVVTSTFVYTLSLAIVLGFILGSGISPRLEWLEMIPLLLLLVLFTVGLALVLSMLYVWIRDVQPIWVVTARLLFFITPVFYPVSLAPPGLRHVLLLSPLAVVIEQGRHVLIDPTAQSAAAAAGGAAWLAVPIGVTVMLLGLGLLLYRRGTGIVAERI